jgi:mevalonate kinase
MIHKAGTAFNSKILLFGEYSLMKGSMALSAPYDKFNGQLLIDRTISNKKSDHYSVQYLIDYSHFLETNSFDNDLNLDKFKFDINNGLFFECNIPVSYGLGSSGAIVASIYNAYTRNKKRTNPADLISLFSRMESYYHGNSSGLDPLTSFTNKPVLINENKVIESINIPDEYRKGSGLVFLLDTKTKSETQPLVRWFLSEYEKSIARKETLDQLGPINNKCITGFLSGKLGDILSHIKNLSNFTLNNMKPMIPDNIISIWKRGLESDNYYLKLCGSGGGGMMLGFTKDENYLSAELNNYDTHVIYRF